MKSKSQTLFTVVTALALLLSACRANISHNNDGSLTVETNLTQQELQEAITASIADPLVQSLTVSLQSGYALVNGQRQHLNDASKTDDLSFRLDLGVNNDQLTATISNAELDGIPIEKDRVDHWNQTIASRIVIMGKKNPNSSLQSVSVLPDSVTMSWDVSR